MSAFPHIQESFLVNTQDALLILDDPEVIDILSVLDTNYALVTRPGRAVPGCIAIPPAALPSRLRELIARGYSHRHRKPYALVVGVFPWAVFTYTLENLPAPKKQTFSHALVGTQTRTGLLQQWLGEKMGRGAFMVPVNRELEAIAFLDHWGVHYTREVMLRER